MSEFAGCSKWAAQLRKSLASLIHLFQGTYFPMLVSTGKAIQKHDTDHVKGQRSIKLSKVAKLIEGLNFNSYHPFDQVLSNRYTIAFSDDKTTATLSMHDFISHAHLKWPNRINVYRIALVMAQIADYDINKESGEYQPVVPGLSQRSVCSTTEWLQDSTDPIEISLSASFAEPALQQPGTTVVIAIGIELLTQPTNPAYLNTSGPGTMKIAECFV